jgi:fumarate hydratase class II
VEGIEPNITQIEKHLNNSLMLVTALNPYIGYDNAATIAKKAHQENKTLREAALESGLVSEKDFNKWVDPSNMI